MSAYLLNFTGRRLATLLAGVAAAIIIVYFLQIEQGARLLQKRPPDWSMIGWLRLVGCTATGFLLVMALRPEDDDRGPIDIGHAPSAVLAVIVGGMLFSSVLTIAVLAAEPSFLYSLVNEYAVGEMVSEAMLAIAALLLFGAALRMRGASAGRILRIPAALTLAGLGAIVALIFLEEISWGQKFLQWSTPDAFEGNLQAETNIHNFYTHRFEFIYYSGAILAFVVLPFMWPKRLSVPLWRAVDFYVPPRYFVLPGVLLTAFMFETWGILPFQIYYLMGLFMLAALWGDEPRRDVRFLIAVTAVVMIAAQFASLLQGHAMTRSHDLTEVRELLISIMVLGYALWMRRQAAALTGKR